MIHECVIRDMDHHFIIDPVTRSVTNAESKKTKLMQRDHNSECFTFEVNREVEGHDMSECNVVRIHYNNIESGGTNTTKGLYEVQDLTVNKNDSAKVILSWTITEEATQYPGPLSFIIEFKCVDANGKVTYRWWSDVNASISISAGINNDDYVVEEYADIIDQWKTELFGGLSEVQEQIANKIWQSDITDAVETAVEGINTTVEGLTTAVEGINTTVEGVNTTVEGLTTTVEGVNTTVEGLTTTVNDITVYGRNLIKDSTFNKASDKWRKSGSFDVNFNNGYLELSKNETSGRVSYYQSVSFSDTLVNPLLKNSENAQTYTASIEVMKIPEMDIPDNSNFEIHFGGTQKRLRITMPTDLEDNTWTRLTATTPANFNATGDMVVRIYLGSAAGGFACRNAKLESWTTALETVNEKINAIDVSGSGLTEEQAADLAANTEARHEHSNLKTLEEFYCAVSELENDNGMTILPDVVGLDRVSFRGIDLRYCSDGGVVKSVEEIEREGTKYLRLWFHLGDLIVENNVPEFIDIPVNLVTERAEEITGPGLTTNSTGLELDLGMSDSEDLSHTHENKELLDSITEDMLDKIGTGGSSHEHANLDTLDRFEGTDDSVSYSDKPMRFKVDGNVITGYDYTDDEIIIKLDGGVEIGGVFYPNDPIVIPLGGGSGDLSQFIEQTASSANLYLPMVDGWTDDAFLMSNGTESTGKTAYCITPQITVKPETTYTIKPLPWGNLGDNNKGRCYDEQGNALAQLTWTINGDSATFTTPANTAYVRFSVFKTDFDNLPNNDKNDIEIIKPVFNNSFMLVEGTTAPEKYEPYGQGKYRLKDIEIPLKSVSLENVNDKTLPIFAPLAGKKIANFGDSIFGNARPPEDVSTYLAEKTGAEVLNCAFGGCRMAIHSQLGHWNAFTMVQLAQAIANGDYSVQDEALNYDDRTSYAEQPLSVIKATDFSAVDILTIAYGTNDFTSNISLDNAENPYDTTTLAGALRTSVESLLTAYPNLRIFVLSLTYRFYIDDNNEYTDDSNTRTNGNNVTIPEFNAKLKEVAEEYNLPYVDDYNIGIGKFNRSQYFPVTDGTHHNEKGRRLIAEHLAKQLY